jgi:hypothetical protein
MKRTIIKLKLDFNMTNFEKMKNQFSKMTRFLKSKKDFVVFFMLLIVWICLLCLVKIPDHQSDTEIRVKIICNDISSINYPMASGRRTSLKKMCIMSGIIWHSCLNMAIISIAVKERLERAESLQASLKLYGRALLWIATIFTGSVFVWLWGNNHYSETRLAPNFLTACRPLDLPCSPDSPIVWVECTRRAEMWMPALSNSLPTLAAVEAYLMVITLIQIVHYCPWSIMSWSLMMPPITVALVCLGFTVTTGYCVIYCNEASFNIDFVSGYIKSLIVACVWGYYSILDYSPVYWTSEDPSNDLPRFWNDVPRKEIIPGKGQLPTSNSIPSPHQPQATTSGTTAGLQ